MTIDASPQPCSTGTGFTRAAAAFDAGWQARIAPLTGQLSPVSQALAFVDWSSNLAMRPAHAFALAVRGLECAGTALGSTLQGQPPHGDGRFDAAAWQAWPWSALAHAHQAAGAWWQEASQVPGMTAHHQEMTRFFANRWLDLFAPCNIPALNPEVQARTITTHGTNLLQGATNLMNQWRQQHGLARVGDGQAQWRPGVEVAVTPGKVVFRNHLIELIQYLPITASVAREPLLIVPSWIMKYYILDLSPHNSLVRWLVDQGHTVFIISWRNPDAADADLTLQDYLDLGPRAALAAIARALPDTPVHACGYCLGGTLLALTAARLAEAGTAHATAPLASVTLLAAETDFSEPGELGLMIDEAQVALLEALMAQQGFLSGRQMASSFTFLHARELYWAHLTRTLWLGEPDTPNDLMAWNADVTRMPAAMHGEYLRRCYLHNELAEGRFPVDGRPVSLSNLELPLFVVGTERDHVSPWRSVYKIHRLTHTEVTFVLADSGHNAGIVAAPGHPRRHHAWATRRRGDPVPHPDGWLAAATRQDGSWWPTWHEWLRAHGSAKQVKARVPATETVLDDAPGRYVQVRHAD